MKKRFMSAFLVVIMLFSMLSTTAFAASSEEEALGEINIFNGGVTMSYLSKIMLEELPEYKQLRKCSVFDYEPEWKSREEAERQRRAPEKRSDMEETESPPNLQQSTRNPDAHGAARQAADPPVAGKPSVPQRQETGNTCIYDIPSMKNATPESIGLVEMTRSAIISSDDPELEEMDDPSRIPPGRGI